MNLNILPPIESAINYSQSADNLEGPAEGPEELKDHVLQLPVIDDP